MLGISEEIRKAIEELGFEHPTPVQEEVIPYLLGEGNDVIALAQTGTGKTAAYGLPLIQKLIHNKSTLKHSYYHLPVSYVCRFLTA